MAGCVDTGIVAPLGRAPQHTVSRPAVASIGVARDSNAIPARHRVTRGDTLYSIAWRYRLDYRQLADWNAITEPYTIYVGQELRLTGSGAPGAKATRALPDRGVSSAKPLPPVSTDRRRPRTVAKARPAAPPTQRRGTQPKPPAVRARAASKPAAVARRWQWPARGQVIQNFSQSARKGIEIGGKRGQPVYAAAAGTVVYRGSGLIGYGELIILKHDARFLSAYAHNDSILVREGDAVKNGQRIASMGRSGSNRVKLHFEIRRDGKPVDPLRYLPHQ